MTPEGEAPAAANVVAAPSTQELPAPSALEGLVAARAAAPRVPLPPANGDLVGWQEERKGAAAAGSCELCASRPARARCLGCEAGVCLQDRWTMFGLCKRCLRPEHLRRWHQAGRVEESNWLTSPAVP
ncbi:MAG: hypothetical protein ACYDBQ_02445 [Thermoplasmatota archaeon]